LDLSGNDGSEQAMATFRVWKLTGTVVSPNSNNCMATFRVWKLTGTVVSPNR